MSFAELFKATPYVILDGGLGTTLEDVYNMNIATPIWSSQAILENPGILIDAHLSFMRAGARVINTATYQASFSSFELVGYSWDIATQLMRKAVDLASQARTRFVEQTPDANVKISLSLGPFGATLSPVAHEGDGIYPPPYGPQAHDPSTSNRNAYTADEKARGFEVESIDALAQFHLDRLKVYASDAATWAKIDCLAFETVPLAREIEAIKAAMSLLKAESGDRIEWKPWLISAVFPNPDGRFPEESTPGGPTLSAKDVFETMLYEIPTKASGVDRYLVPDGMGVNCTMLKHVQDVVKEAEEVVRRRGVRPWLVLKPNGGQTYEPVTKTWNSQTAEDSQWSRALGEFVKERDGWGGYLAGGCCKTGCVELKGLCDVFS